MGPRGNGTWLGWGGGGEIVRTYLMDIVPASRGLRARRRCASPPRLRRDFRIFPRKKPAFRDRRVFSKAGCVDPEKPRLERSSGLRRHDQARSDRVPLRPWESGPRRACRILHSATHGGRPLGGRERRARISRRPGRVVRRGPFRARARGATKTRAGTRGRVFLRFFRPGTNRRHARRAFSGRFPTTR